MKKPFFYIILLLCTPFWSLAQDIDNDTYREALDYVNCKLTELSLKNQVDQPHYAAFQDATKFCDMRVMNQQFYDEVLKKFLDNRKLGRTRTLTLNIDNLKVNPNNKPNYVAEQLTTFLIDTLLKSSKNVRQFIQKHQTSYNNLEGQMKTRITAHFKKNEANQFEEDENDGAADRDFENFRDTHRDGNSYINQDGGRANSEIENDDIEDRDRDTVYDNEEHQSFFEKHRTTLLLGFFLIGFILYYLNKNGVTFFNRDNVIERERLATPDEFNQLREEITLIRHQTNSLEEDMNRLKFKFSNLERRLGITSDDEPKDVETIEEQTETSDIDTDDVIDLTQDTDTDNIVFNFDDINKDAIDDDVDTTQGGIGYSFFMSIPDENGIFDANSVSEIFKRPVSVYLFTITSKDGNQAEFSIYEDIATMIRALDNFDEYLRPACKSNAILHKNATKIVTESKGLAIREGNRWRVIEKANIHYA